MPPADRSGSQGLMPCVFCAIAAGGQPAALVSEDAAGVAFLDHRPLFPGHVLLVPRLHVETLADLPAHLVAPVFVHAQLLQRAVERALRAEGAFVAINNRVSQSVPHLHIHIVPRRRKDGLKGFFWPRTAYRDTEHLLETARLVRAAAEALRQSQ